VTKKQRREYREWLTDLGLAEAKKLRAFLRANKYPEDRGEKLAIVREVIKQLA
jgi:hypothetical protein